MDSFINLAPNLSLSDAHGAPNCNPWAQFHRAAKQKNLLSMKLLP